MFLCGRDQVKSQMSGQSAAYKGSFSNTSNGKTTRTGAKRRGRDIKISSYS